MKKTIALLLSALLLLGALAACGEAKTEEAPKEAPATAAPAPTAAPAASTPVPTPEPTPEPTPPVEGPFSPEGSVIFEQDGLKATTAGLDVDPTTWEEQPIIWLDIENSGSADVYLGLTGAAANGFVTDAYLIDFCEEEGDFCGGDYSFGQMIPAGETVRYALGYNASSAPGIPLTPLAELTLCFTLAGDEFSWPDYTSEPVTILTGETVEAVDIVDLGAVVIDNETLRIVFGAQDHDDFFGPTVDVYVENKTDNYISLYAESAEADGVFCDYVYGTAAAGPHQIYAGWMCFDGELAELKGFENLIVCYDLKEAGTQEGLNDAAAVTLDAASATYPPQIWGEYENSGLTLEVKPKYNALVTVQTPVDDPKNQIFTVSETASLDAGDFEGAGWLFSIGAVSADELHEMLCYDMSGAEVFAKDENGNYYIYYHPTDVRYERATVEEMQRDADQWSMLCEWADGMKDAFREANELANESYGNSTLDIYIARAAWDKDTKATIAYLEPYGEVSLEGVDGTAYADFLLHGYFWEDWDGALEAPDGEYMVLNIPEENMRIDFFWGDPTITRMTRDGEERLYEAMWCDDNISFAEAVHGWYYAAAEKAGLKEADTSLDAFCGVWAEKIAGRGMLTVTKSVAPGKVNIYGRWPESAFAAAEWQLVGALEEGELFYENGHFEVNEFDENGDSWNTDWSDEESGKFYFNAAGELCWHDDSIERGEDSTFIRAN